MARSDLMKFWKLLVDTKFTGRRLRLTEDGVRRMSEVEVLP
jgi:hypothetical protein